MSFIKKEEEEEEANQAQLCSGLDTACHNSQSPRCIVCLERANFHFGWCCSCEGHSVLAEQHMSCLRLDASCKQGIMSIMSLLVEPRLHRGAGLRQTSQHRSVHLFHRHHSKLTCGSFFQSYWYIQKAETKVELIYLECIWLCSWLSWYPADLQKDLQHNLLQRRQLRERSPCWLWNCPVCDHSTLGFLRHG